MVNLTAFEQATPSPHEEYQIRLGLAQEFQILSSLHHPNIVRVYDYGFDPEQGPYYTMELLNNARDILSVGAPLELNEKVRLVAQLLRGLSYLHRRGSLHRDIKPSNVLCQRGEIKIVDFGIAINKAVDAELAGTIEYMAPELLLGGKPSAASDLYAVGVILYQLLEGRIPVSRDSMTHMLYDLLGSNTEMSLPPDAMALLEGYYGGWSQRLDRTDRTDGPSDTNDKMNGGEATGTALESSYDSARWALSELHAPFKPVLQQNGKVALALLVNIAPKKLT